MSMRVRLPQGILREVDATARLNSAQQRRGEARREAWPSSQIHSQPQLKDSVTYSPGAPKVMVACDIEALLLPINPNDGLHVVPSKHSSLVEEMLQKATASASAMSGFSSVPWDPAADDSASRDYLRSIMTQMNRDVAVHDATDEDIQQMIDDPDAYIARTTGARAKFQTAVKNVVQSVVHLSSDDQPRIREVARTRKLVQGASCQAAQEKRIYSFTSTEQGSNAQSGITAPDTSSILAHDVLTADQEVPLEEMVDRKQEQAHEMQALCERLQSLVATAKELVSIPTGSRNPAPRASALPPAQLAPAVSVPAVGMQIARNGGVMVRAQNVPAHSSALVMPASSLFEDRGAEGIRRQSVSSFTLDAPNCAQRQGAVEVTQVPPSDANPWRHADGDVSLHEEGDTQEGDKEECEAGGQSVLSLKSGGGGEKNKKTDGGKSAQGTTDSARDQLNDNENGKAVVGSPAPKRFQKAVKDGEKVNKIVEVTKEPVFKGAKVSAMAGQNRNNKHASDKEQVSADNLRAMLAKLAGAWKNVGEMFNHFDRPDVEDDGDLKGDQQITLDEFARGIRDMKLEFTDEEVVQVFNLVDVDKSGAIDHKELEAVLHTCGMLRSVAVKRVPKTANTFKCEAAEKKIEDETAMEMKAKKKGKKGQPIDPPGMSQQVAEGLTTLNERVEELRTQLQDVRGECSQFDLILEQYNKAPQSEAGEHTRKALLKTGEAMVERMASGISRYKALAKETHEYSVNLIHELPRDYRVVWKQAVCSEIDEKGGLVRVLNEEMYECEKDFRQMRDECREWRLADKNDRLDLTLPKNADGDVARHEKFKDVLAQSREWLKSAVSYGFANEDAVLKKLGTSQQHKSEDEVLSAIQGAHHTTTSLAGMLAPYVDVGKAHIVARQAARAYDPHARTYDSHAHDKKSGSNAIGKKHKPKTQAAMQEGEGMSAASAGGGSNTLSLSMSVNSTGTPQRQGKVSAAVLVSGSSLNYDAMYHQLHIAQQLRAQLEDGLEAADLSSIANTSVDTAVRQLVSSRIMQVARDVKESVDNERTRTRASALLSSPTAAPAKTHRGGAATAAAASSSGAHAPSAPHARRMRMRGEPEEDMREQEPSTTARTAGRSRPKTEWQKLDERMARNAAAVSTARAQLPVSPVDAVLGKFAAAATIAGKRHVPAHVELRQMGQVRRTTRPPPSRIISLPHTATRSDGNGNARAQRAHSHTASSEAVVTRIARACTHFIPTGSCALLMRPSSVQSEEGEEDGVEDMQRETGLQSRLSRQSLLLPESPAAQALSDLQQAALKQMIFCGIVFELRLSAAGAWTLLAEANFVRELAAVLNVRSSELGLKARVSDLVPTCLELQLLNSKDCAGDVVERVSSQAQDPTSSLWAMPMLAKMTVQGMVFEKSGMQDSPPKQDFFKEAYSQDASPQLASGVWEEVRAPMIREAAASSLSADNRDLTKDQPAPAPAPAPAPVAVSSRRSLDFYEIPGEGSIEPLAIKHRKPQLQQERVHVHGAEALALDEETITERVLSYLSHHVLAHVETDARFQAACMWRDSESDSLQHLAQLRRHQRTAGACSPFIAGLLGSEGLMLLMHAGIDIEDVDVLELAESSILEEARRIFRKEKAGDRADSAAQSEHEQGIAEPPQPARHGRQIVLRESTKPVTTGRAVQDDAAAQKLILHMLLEMMQSCEVDEEADAQAQLDAETRKELTLKKQEEQSLETLTESRLLTRSDSARQSVASLISQDGEAMILRADEVYEASSAVQVDDIAVGRGNVKGAESTEAGNVYAVRQPPVVVFDKGHQQRVEDTLARIADSMDALTHLTLQLAAAAERSSSAPAHTFQQQAVGAVHARGGDGQSPSQPSDAAYSVGSSLPGGTASVSPSGNSGSPTSDILESDYTPPKSADDEVIWSHVKERASCATDETDETLSADVDAHAASLGGTIEGGATSAIPRVLQLETHSAQTSMDFDAVFSNLRANARQIMRGKSEATDKQLQTSVDLDERSVQHLSAYTSAPSSPDPPKDRASPNRSAVPRVLQLETPKMLLGRNTLTELPQGDAGGGVASSEMPEPWTQSLLSTLRSVADEMALLRQTRMVQPPQSMPEATGAGEGVGNAKIVAGEGDVENEKGQEACKLAGAMALEDWIGSVKQPVVNAGVQMDTKDFGAVAVHGGVTEPVDSQGDHSGSSPDASTSLSEGEWRPSASALMVDTSLTMTDSPPRSQALLQESDPPPGMHPSHSVFALTLSGEESLPEQIRFPWREGGPVFRESLEEACRAGRTERRAARREERRARRLRSSLRSSRDLMTAIPGHDTTAGTPRTESELSDGEVASSVVWWVGTGGKEDYSLRESGGDDSQTSDGEIRRPA